MEESYRKRGSGVPWNRGATLEQKIHAAWDSAERDGDCWIWPAHITKNGYGHVREPKYGTWLAHRAAKFVANGGKLSKSDVVHHACGRRSCVNPDHLQVVEAIHNVAESHERATYRRQLLKMELEALTLEQQTLALETFLVERALDGDFGIWLDEWSAREPDPAPDEEYLD